MIERVSFQRFKILADVDVVLRQLTVVVGPNSSGKTTFLQYLAGKAANQPDDPDLVRFTHLRNEEVTNSIFLQLDTSRLRAPSYSSATVPHLTANGTGLASVLADLKLRSEENFDVIVSSLRQVVPTLEDIRIRRAHVPQADGAAAPSGEKLIGFELLFDMKGARDIPAQEVSDGTLLTLALLTALKSDDKPSRLVLWDDMERGLHPKAMGQLVVQLRQLLATQPELQIVASSHSPYLLDHLQPEEILLTALREDGTATIAPLTNHPDLERWRGLMTPGELWSTFGESWILPAHAQS